VRRVLLERTSEREKKTPNRVREEQRTQTSQGNTSRERDGEEQTKSTRHKLRTTQREHSTHRTATAETITTQPPRTECLRSVRWHERRLDSLSPEWIPTWDTVSSETTEREVCGSECKEVYRVLKGTQGHRRRCQRKIRGRTRGNGKDAPIHGRIQTHTYTHTRDTHTTV
jgi:hypothetical protein